MSCRAAIFGAAVSPARKKNQDGERQSVGPDGSDRDGPAAWSQLNQTNCWADVLRENSGVIEAYPEGPPCSGRGKPGREVESLRKYIYISLLGLVMATSSSAQIPANVERPCPSHSWINEHCLPYCDQPNNGSCAFRSAKQARAFGFAVNMHPKHRVRHAIAKTLIITLKVVTAPVWYPVLLLIDIGAAS